MRLWTIHPKHLDKPGLGAAWREGLLAQAVLLGKTKGYRHHPQLERFYAQPDPVAAIASYLADLHEEATARGYNYDAGKIHPSRSATTILVTDGQLEFERGHLNAKIEARSPKWPIVAVPAVHPLFEVVPGEIERWEVAYWGKGRRSVGRDWTPDFTVLQCWLFEICRRDYGNVRTSPAARKKLCNIHR